MERIIKTRTFPLAIVLLLFLLLFGVESGCEMKSFIYFPKKKIVRTPADDGLFFEDLSLRTSDGVKINGWFIPSPGARTTLLWLHGNGGNIGNTIGRLKQFHHALKTNILVIDYREYGKSGGEVSEEGTYLDAVAAYDYLLTRSDVDPTRIIPFGYSLGSAVAVELSLQRKAEGLILEAPFASIQEMAGVVFPWLPVGPFITTRYNTLSKIGSLEVPLLILHGDQDDVVPFTQGREVFEAARAPKTFYTVSGAGHNNTTLIGGQAYLKTVADFIARLP